MLTCNLCQKSFRNVKGNPNRFCSHNCAAQYRGKLYIGRWLRGEETGYIQNNYRLSGHVRTFLMKEANNKCSECSWSKMNPKSGKIPLHIDHIDGNAANCRRENLRVLCPNCHSLTPNFGALNMGRSVRK